MQYLCSSSSLPAWLSCSLTARRAWSEASCFCFLTVLRSTLRWSVGAGHHDLLKVVWCSIVSLLWQKQHTTLWLGCLSRVTEEGVAKLSHNKWHFQVIEELFVGERGWEGGWVEYISIRPHPFTSHPPDVNCMITFSPSLLFCYLFAFLWYFLAGNFHLRA